MSYPLPCPNGTYTGDNEVGLADSSACTECPPGKYCTGGKIRVSKIVLILCSCVYYYYDAVRLFHYDINLCFRMIVLLAICVSVAPTLQLLMDVLSYAMNWRLALGRVLLGHTA